MSRFGLSERHAKRALIARNKNYYFDGSGDGGSGDGGVVVTLFCTFGDMWRFTNPYDGFEQQMDFDPRCAELRQGQSSGPSYGHVPELRTCGKCLLFMTEDGDLLFVELVIYTTTAHEYGGTSLSNRENDHVHPQVALLPEPMQTVEPSQ